MSKFFLISLLLSASVAQAQNDLLDELSDLEEPTKDEVFSTFQGTRLINGHSVETKHRASLEFIITHRFGTLNSGGYNLWGLDDASIRLGLEYGITDNLGVGIGRSSFDKSFDYYLKYKILTEKQGVPVTITAFGSAAYNASMNVQFPELKTGDKMAYTGELLVAKKLSSRLSLQLMPIFIYRSTVDQSENINGLFSLGFGGRAKITRSMALVGEYYWRLNENENNPNHDALGMAVEFETGGHIFQLVFTNAIGMIERGFVAETTGDFFKGDIRFGFNITRTFQFGRKK